MLKHLLASGVWLLAIAWSAAAAESERTVQSLEDTASGQRYEITLVVPPAGPAPAGGYAVLFLLDGHHTLPVARQWLADHGRAGEVVLVGIDDADSSPGAKERRVRAMTPMATADWPQAGDNAAFIEFIDTQVKPWVADRVALDARRTALFGHSLGGLTTLTQMVRAPSMFSHYLVASPSLWWADEGYKPALESFVGRQGCGEVSARRVVVTVGRNEQPLAGPARERLSEGQREKLNTRHMVDNARWVANLLGQCEAWQIDVTVLQDKDHHAARAAGLASALAQWLGSVEAPADQSSASDAPPS